jgi:hypothetical protein
MPQEISKWRQARDVIIIRLIGIENNAKHGFSLHSRIPSADTVYKNIEHDIKYGFIIYIKPNKEGP